MCQSEHQPSPGPVPSLGCSAWDACRAKAGAWGPRPDSMVRGRPRQVNPHDPQAQIWCSSLESDHRVHSGPATCNPQGRCLLPTEWGLSVPSRATAERHSGCWKAPASDTHWGVSQSPLVRVRAEPPTPRCMLFPVSHLHRSMNKLARRNHRTAGGGKRTPNRKDSARRRYQRHLRSGECKPQNETHSLGSFQQKTGSCTERRRSRMLGATDG